MISRFTWPLGFLVSPVASKRCAQTRTRSTMAEKPKDRGRRPIDPGWCNVHCTDCLFIGTIALARLACPQRAEPNMVARAPLIDEAVNP